MSDTSDTNPTPPADPPPDVNPAPASAEAFPDSSIQGILGSGGQAVSNVHYRSRSNGTED